MEGDYLIQVDQQMTCAIFVHNVSPNIPEKKDNMQCVEVESKELTVISGDKKGINELEILF